MNTPQIKKEINITNYKQANDLIIELERFKRDLTNCNVAITPPKTQFELAYEDREAMTVDLTNKILQDFESLIQQRDGNRFYNFTELILGLIQWYRGLNKPHLNLILQPDALEDNQEAQQYIKYPYQKAADLRRMQRVYPFVQIGYDSETNRLGIFCNVEPMARVSSSTFMGKITNHLMKSNPPVIVVETKMVPKSYQGYGKHTLKQKLKQRFPDNKVEIDTTREDCMVISLTEKV